MPIRQQPTASRRATSLRTQRADAAAVSAAASSRISSPDVVRQKKATPDFIPHPDWLGTALCVLGLFITGLLDHEKTPTQIARFAAIGTALSLLASIACDARRGGLRNLVRADLLALISLYYLTLCEFLFPQPMFDTMVVAPSVTRGVIACFVGFAGLVIGRHLISGKRQPFESLFTAPVSTTLIFSVFAISFFGGFAYMLACCNFNPVLMVRWFMEPRFSQPWSRGALGDWRAMLHELEMLLFLVPPLGGVVLARRKRFSTPAILFVCFGVFFTLFYGFCSGTRYFLAAYLITLVAGFAFAASARQKKEIIVASVVAAVVMLISTVLMLEFRHMGLRAFFAHDYEEWETPGEAQDDRPTLYVDLNLYPICRIVETFPRVHDYLGFEMPFLAIVRPVPRALWPGKPEGVSFPIEDVVGADGWTVAATFVGEAYMSGGNLAVFLIALALGALARWWGLLASPRNSEFGVLIYASGFFAAAMAMRSMLVLTTALLPSVVGIIGGFIFIRRIKSIKARRAEKGALHRGSRGIGAQSAKGARAVIFTRP